MRAIASMRLRAVLWTAAFAAIGGFCMGGIVFHDSTDDAPANYHSRIAQAPTYDQAAFLMKVHDCWSGPAPADMAGKIPGHAIVTPRGYWPMYVGAKLTGKALDQQFGGKPAGLTVYGFCR